MRPSAFPDADVSGPVPKSGRVTRLGKYHLVERLGRGGMAEVWKAKIMGPGGFSRTLVVKRILPHLVEDPQFVQMFLGEARLSAQLSHPNIVSVHELGDVAGEYFIAMEYVRGRDLVTVLRALLAVGKPDPGLGAYVVRDTARALAYAHALRGENGNPLRIIHRDVSPSNVMVTFDGGVKLVDFGLAKALSESGDDHTRTGTLKGKFGYMAPEQIQAIPVDHRIDVWATGVVLWETLTGRRLFKGTSDLQTIALVRERGVDPPSLLNPTVPASLDRICLRALARDRDQRYASCDEIAAELDEVVRELRWGPDRLASLMQQLFPGGELSDASVVPSTEPTAATANEHRSPSARRWWIAAAGSLLVAGGVLGVALQAHHPSSPTSGVVATLPTLPSPAAPALPSMVGVDVMSTPAGATLFLDEEAEPRGVTPLHLALPRATRERVMRLELAGYLAKRTRFLPEKDIVLQPELAALPVAVAAPPARRHVAAKARPRPTATGSPPLREVTPPPAVRSDLKRGDVVDPFK